MHCLRDNILLSLLLASLVTALLTSDCHADCMACWELRGVIVEIKNGATIEGYATWNESWAALGYQGSGLSDKESIDRALEKNKFPKMIFDPKAQISGIAVYTHLRSIKYPVANALVTFRDPVEVNVEDIKDLKLSPGPHDGYDGAGVLPVVSQKIADLLQTKPSSFCERDHGTFVEYWISYDDSFPEDELQRLCGDELCDKQGNLDKKIEDDLSTRNIFSLSYAYD
jgi:hypothetical protein